MKHRTSKAVTLIELIVALSIFAVVMIIALDSFSKVIRYTRESVQKQSLQDHTQFVFDLMSKEIRMAKIKYSEEAEACDAYFNNTVSDCPAGEAGGPDNNQLYYTTANHGELRFINYEDNCVRYFLKDDASGGVGVRRLSVERYNPTLKSCKWAFVSPTAINVESLYFNVTDLVVQSGDAAILRKPATVGYYLKMKGVLWDPPTVDYFNLITARNFEQF